MNFPGISGLVCGVMRVIGSTVVGRHSAVLVGGEGQVGALDATTDEDVAGQRMDDVEMYSALGVIARPRAPETIEGDLLGHEAMYLELGGILTPVAHRDLQLNRKFPAPKPRTVALVGYGGGFLSFDDTDALENRTTWYMPYAAGAKAMVVAMNPDDESLMLVHGDGYAVVLDATNGITMRSKTGESWVSLKDDKFEVVATEISLRGNVALGANTSGALPLLAGAASPACPSLFVSVV